jgi:type IV pilus assembly protein PilO
MTNLQEARDQRDAGLAPAMLRRLWFWGPMAGGGALAALVLLSAAVPQWLAISGDRQRLSELEGRREEAELLKLQTMKVVKERRDAERQREELIQLVSGSGDGGTFLATLDLEARQSGVKLQLFEPTPAPPGAPGAAAAPGASGAAGAAGAAGAPPAQPGPDGKAPPPPPDPMAQAGLKKRALLLSARGTYPQLLAFLRRLELLDVLVEQSNLTLVVAGSERGKPAAANSKELPPVVPEVEAKVNLTLYSKKPKEEAASKDREANVASPGTKP